MGAVESSSWCQIVSTAESRKVARVCENAGVIGNGVKKE